MSYSVYDKLYLKRREPMLATLKPVFDKDMSVQCYCVIAQRENVLKNIMLVGTESLDMAANILGLDIVNSLSTNTFDKNQKVIVNVNNIALFTDIESQVKISPDKIVLMLDGKMNPDEAYINRLKTLKNEGYTLGTSGVTKDNIKKLDPVLDLVNIVVIDDTEGDTAGKAKRIRDSYHNVTIMVSNVANLEELEELKDCGECEYYEGSFYTVPVSVKKHEVSPVKMTYLNLLNYVNSKDFDLKKASEIIGQDPALVISLMKKANRRARNSEITSIPNAAAMMGQVDLRSWAHTAITKELCADKPDALTRIALIRAKFFENIAGFFGLRGFSSELFLTGEFSVLDIMLDVPMQDALDKVHVSDDIRRVLTDHDGPLSPVFDFALAYEQGDWQYVDRELLVRNIKSDDIHNEYVNALQWFKEAFR